MAIKMGRGQNYKNIVINLLAFIIQFIISFYVSPIIVKKVGAAAYGFIGLANDFVSYASIVATVFNSVASRFIANAFYQKDFERANSYFNSLIVTNIILAGILGLIAIILVPQLDGILTIPTELIVDVKLTFALIFGSYIISLLTLVFTTSTFVTNRTDIQGIRNVVNYIIRFSLIIIFLNFVSIHIYWIALATLIASIWVAIMNLSITKRLTPELKINIQTAKKEYSFELAKSGCWMALTSISTILLRGFDLTIANIMLSDYEMGLLSIARTIPNNVTSVVATIAPIFTPSFIALYSQRNTITLVENVNKSINVMASLLFVPISGFIIFSYDFYTLWQNSLSHKEIVIITILSCITIIQSFFDSTTATMAQLSVVTNKLKLPVLVSLGCGIISISVEILLVKQTTMGLYAIVLVPTITMISRYIIFNSIYAARCLKQPKYCFFPAVLKTWTSIPILLLTMSLIKIFFPVYSWRDFAQNIVLGGVLGYIEIMILYQKNIIIDYIQKCKRK